MKLDSLVTVAESRTLDKLLDIMDNASHPLHTVISNQRSLFSERLLLPKYELRRLLVEKLWERGLFTDESTAEVAGKADTEIRDPVPPVSHAPKDPPVSPGVSAEELQLTL
ncbi:hypothetical protein L3Q82_000685 [Scortum barcoo]|uniref:Uncharacterized protein n=1 Tax=Scortum barcoo TaxID=214431 RepID=A0ACB8WGE9_9TELE|nr:hypothetical protein L3Q82_000685 [Scortum barcoo]